MNKNYKLAAIFMIIHGGLMEIGTALVLLPLKLMGVNISGGASYAFTLPFFQDNLQYMLVMALIFGVLRLIGAIALLRGYMWGFALSLINTIVTLVLMIAMIPSGIADGILASLALIFLLKGYYGIKKVNS